MKYEDGARKIRIEWKKAYNKGVQGDLKKFL